MLRSRKPIHACYTCRLNLGDHCWGHACPREQWDRRRVCPSFDNPSAYQLFVDWQKQATVKSRRELRQESFRRRPQPPVPYLEVSPGGRAEPIFRAS